LATASRSASKLRKTMWQWESTRGATGSVMANPGAWFCPGSSAPSGG